MPMWDDRETIEPTVRSNKKIPGHTGSLDNWLDLIRLATMRALWLINCKDRPPENPFQFPTFSVFNNCVVKVASMIGLDEWTEVGEDDSVSGLWQKRWDLNLRLLLLLLRLCGNSRQHPAKARLLCRKDQISANFSVQNEINFAWFPIMRVC